MLAVTAGEAVHGERRDEERNVWLYGAKTKRG
jgi:hypothetical protein